MSERVTIVAEIGQNHNGSLDLALKLIDAAKTAGADFVKFQKREPRYCVPRDQWEKRRDTPWGEMSYIEYRERLELSMDDYQGISAYCEKVGIGWFISPWDVRSCERMAYRFDLPMLKIASASLTDEALLRAVAKAHYKIVISTGMSTAEEIARAVEVLEDACGGLELTICHCNSTYPCPPKDLNLRCILSLQAAYPFHQIGYSGHETGLPTTVAAVALGATYIERHITLDRAMWGTDHAASIEPGGFKRLVHYIRVTEEAMGDGVKRITDGEVEPRQRLRKVAASPLFNGLAESKAPVTAALTRENIEASKEVKP